MPALQAVGLVAMEVVDTVVNVVADVVAEEWVRWQRDLAAQRIQAVARGNKAREQIVEVRIHVCDGSTVPSPPRRRGYS